MILKRLLLLFISSCSLGVLSMATLDDYLSDIESKRREFKSFNEDSGSQKDTVNERSGGQPNPSWQNICTAGADPSKMSVRAYMTAFAAGPCSPMVLIPGVLASILRVEIRDCEAFKQADPTTFAACNWTSCSGTQSPKKEYQMWVPAPGTPMTILTPTEMNKDCFAGLIETVFTTLPNGTWAPTQKPGILVTAKGLSQETIYTSECGTKGVENFIPDIPNPEETEYFKLIIQRLQLMGYKPGLTMQAMPYDFRLSSGYDQASKNLPAVLNLLKTFTNKKVVIAAHSMGNMKTAYAMWNMDQATKDSTVKMWLAIAPPFSGAAKPISYTTCGSNEFFFIDNLGIDMKTWKALAGSFPSIFELMPPPTYTTQASQAWMKKILARIAYEEGKSSDPIFDWLPTKSQICYPNFNQNMCTSGLEVFDDYAVFKQGVVTNSNLKDWLKQHSFSPYTSKFWGLFDSRFETLPNVNVPLAVIYASIVPTEGKFVFFEDPTIPAGQNHFCKRPTQFTWTDWKGDDTVPSTSAVTASLKWSLDFQSQQPGAKPLKLVAMCSNLNVKGTPYDGKDQSGVNTMTQLEYQGIGCDCAQNKWRHCTHIGMVYNPNVVEYLSNSLLTNDVQPVSSMVAGMTDAQLNAFQLNCEILALTYKDQRVEEDSKELTKDTLKRVKDLLNLE